MSIQSEINRLKQNVANAFTAVGNKGGTVPSSKVSGNLATAISSIPSGVTVQRTPPNASFTTDGDGRATVNCGFQPDLVVINPMVPLSEGYDYRLTYPFEVTNNGTVISTLIEHEDGFVYAGVERTSNGFNVTYMNNYNWDWNYVVVANTRCTYTAIKYT